MSLPSLDLLNALVAVAESPNLIEAAGRLGISQPALSMQLQRLEKSLPQPVFTLEGKRKVLTKYGRAVYRASKRHLARLDVSLEKLNRAYASPESLTLKIGARRDFIHRVASLIRFPGKIVFMNLSVEESVQGLLSHTVDLAINYRVPDSLDLIAKPLFTHGVRLAVHRKWLGRRKLDLALAGQRDFLTSIPALLYRPEAPQLSEWVQQAGLGRQDLKVAYVCEDWSALMRLVESGAGYSLIPEDIETHFPEVESIPIPHSIVRPVTYFAIYHRELRKIPAYRKFIEFVSERSQGDL